MLGMIILCLEKVNILFNRTDREWVAISRHFLETGIQGVQMEIRFCAFFLGFYGWVEPPDWKWRMCWASWELLRWGNVEISAHYDPLPCRWHGHLFHPFQAVYPWQMRWETSTSETQTCCFPLPKQHQGNPKQINLPQLSPSAAQQLLCVTHCPGDKSILALEANPGIPAQGFPEVCWNGQEFFFFFKFHNCP